MRSSSSSWTVLSVLSFLLLLSSSTSIQAVDSKSDGGGGGGAQWQILTKLNFSSQIKLHPHLLLMVTVPFNMVSEPRVLEVTAVG
ncbi:hypothetical protein RJ640_019431 [Escallonia rubra]|uniref:Uncharacterized protein n=1 Tax=Escallonia rubra TaxID=112253 RepID=A0AA88R745_9ASTE|nr:hypothetical protein RJ640_019431 [Escallonia rubra]